MGLRYVVLARGARAVVASMWPVADQVSAELMARFYRTLLQEQLRVAPALSDAMRTTIEGRFKDPGLMGSLRSDRGQSRWNLSNNTKPEKSHGETRHGD